MSPLSSAAAPSRRSLIALDVLNLFLADVRDGLGPFLAIYLTSAQKWSPSYVGLAMGSLTVGTVVAQTPAGAIIDVVRQKRSLVAVAAGIVAIACITMVARPSFSVVIGSQIVTGMAAAIFAPAIAALSLGLVGHRHFAARMGRNEAFNHGGNVVTAAIAGSLGYLVGDAAIFVFVAAVGVCSGITVMTIREKDIDHEAARGSIDDMSNAPHVSGILSLIRDRRLMIFSASVVLFHFANAAMLPLVGEKAAHGQKNGASMLMAACIIVAQMVMIPVALASAKGADAWGRKPIFLIAFAVLPIRGLLYMLSTNPAYLIAVQLLDGIGAGIFGVVSVLVVADLTQGTGRFNLTQGALATATGLGAGLSNILTGVIVQHFGFNTGFLTLAMLAGVACVFYAALMPETLATQPEAPKSGEVPTLIAPARV